MIKLIITAPTPDTGRVTSIDSVVSHGESAVSTTSSSQTLTPHGDVSAESRVGSVCEKLRQADPEALKDRGLGRIALCAGLLDLQHAVPELHHPYEPVGGID